MRRGSLRCRSLINGRSPTATGRPRIDPAGSPARPRVVAPAQAATGIEKGRSWRATAPHAAPRKTTPTARRGYARCIVFRRPPLRPHAAGRPLLPSPQAPSSRPGQTLLAPFLPDGTPQPVSALLPVAETTVETPDPARPRDRRRPAPAQRPVAGEPLDPAVRGGRAEPRQGHRHRREARPQRRARRRRGGERSRATRTCSATRSSSGPPSARSPRASARGGASRTTGIDIANAIGTPDLRVHRRRGRGRRPRVGLRALGRAAPPRRHALRVRARQPHVRHRRRAGAGGRARSPRSATAASPPDRTCTSRCGPRTAPRSTRCPGSRRTGSG